MNPSLTDLKSFLDQWFREHQSHDGWFDQDVLADAIHEFLAMDRSRKYKLLQAAAAIYAAHENSATSSNIEKNIRIFESCVDAAETLLELIEGRESNNKARKDKSNAPSSE